MVNFPFDNRYVQLPARFHAQATPTPVRAPALLQLNRKLAEELGLDADALAQDDGVAILAGNQLPEGSDPLAMTYAGYQFGTWVPLLGDGRAILLGEVVDRSGMRRDIQLKGAGPTPFSRRGDGRAGIGPVLREYLLSESMAALGVPTTRSLAAIKTGEPIFRRRPEPGAVLTRVAQSHIRVGTFQFFGARRDDEAVQLLADHTIERHYPRANDAENRYIGLLDAVIANQAKLIAHWQLVGFIHGVMNTDNCSIAGETLDYGPCAFMDSSHPNTVFSSIDRRGRYAYRNQPTMAQWNLVGFAETLLPLFADEEGTAIEMAKESLQRFSTHFENEQLSGWRKKLGLTTEDPSDADLIEQLLKSMAENHADFTLTCRHLCALSADDPDRDGPAREGFDDPSPFDAWAARWRLRLRQENSSDVPRQQLMRSANPAFIPRNHRVEEALQAAEEDNLKPFETLLKVLETPYDDQPEHEPLSAAPRPDQIVHETFCGT